MGNMHKTLVKIGHAVLEICSWTDRQIDHNSVLPYRWWSNKGCLCVCVDETTALEKVVPADKLRSMLQTQLEYYFSA